MRIGSETKTFTVTAMLQRVDRHKLRLNDPIGRYISGGRYFEHNQEAIVSDDPAAAYAEGHGVARFALDPDNARRLWESSERALA